MNRKYEEEMGETKERARMFFPGTVQIWEKQISSTEIRHDEDRKNSSGETFKMHILIPIDIFVWNVITIWFGQPSLR